VVGSTAQNATGRIVIVPHPKKELPIGTTRSTIRQAGLTPKDFGF
jgi:predicted RNA binding protein YcfA (HicA-like mRNA interferase family)